MASVQLYGDQLSQPVRAVLLFCKTNGIPVEVQDVDLPGGGTDTPEFKAVNPLGRVPVIDDAGFHLSESHAIMRYLTWTRLADTKPDVYFLNDAKKRARVDELLDWHHTVLRQGASPYCFSSSIGPAVFGLDAAALRPRAESTRPALQRALWQLDTVLLKRPEAGPFLMGPAMSIADYSMACELYQLKVLEPEQSAIILGRNPRVQAWQEAVKKACAPHWDAVCARLDSVAQKCEDWRSSSLERESK